MHQSHLERVLNCFLQGSDALLVRLYKDAGAPTNECSPFKLWGIVKQLPYTCYIIFRSDLGVHVKPEYFNLNVTAGIPT